MRSLCILMLAMAIGAAAQAGYIDGALTHPAAIYGMLIVAMMGLAYDEYGRRR